LSPSSVVDRPPARLSPGAKWCQVCGSVDRARDDGRGGRTCCQCAEWRIDGCSRFTVLLVADEATEERHGACLACGASWELHARPDVASWRRITDLDNVQIVAIRYVLAVAREVALGRET
jgi:hypothetical protein